MHSTFRVFFERFKTLQANDMQYTSEPTKKNFIDLLQEVVLQLSLKGYNYITSVIQYNQILVKRFQNYVKIG